MVNEQDYYKILDIPPTATDKEVHLAYRKLARQYHPDVNREPDAEEQFLTIHEAYEALNNQTQRKKYDHRRSLQEHVLPSALSLYGVPSHNILQRIPHEQAFYLLLSVMSIPEATTIRLPLNICLVIDRSSSMRGKRLHKVKEAIHQIMINLDPDDSLGLVVFSDKAHVLIENERLLDVPKAKAVVSTIQAGGGTEILQGLKAGITEIERCRQEDSVNHIILLTDGQTYGDAEGCLEQAQWAGERNIHLSMLGIGHDWNEELLDQMASRSGGESIFIDSVDKVAPIFDNTLRNLESVVARQLLLTVDPHAKVYLHEAYQVTPHITRLKIQDRTIKLGSLSANQEKSLLLEFRVQDMSLGKVPLTKIIVEGDIPGKKMKTWESVEPTVEISEQPALNATIPFFITTALSKLAIYKMQEKVKVDIKAGDIKKATKRLQLIATQLLNMGKPELSKVALMEAGHLTRTATLSPAGSKKIKYGTRALPSLADSPRFSTMPLNYH